MLPKVSVHPFSSAPFTNVDDYRRLVGDDLVDELEALSRELRGVRVCHINSTGFGGGVAELLSRLVPLARALGIDADWSLYDVVVFTMEEFVLPGLQARRMAFILPAIDPLSTKNMELPDELCVEVIANAGVDITRPLVTQVSRFDPWKDPMGVVEACRLARHEVAGLQLALVGAIAGDDPEGWKLLAHVQKQVASDDDIYVFTNLAGVGSMEVNAFQRACDLVIQKSLREGFGLVVSESFWKGKPVVAGRAGGSRCSFPPATIAISSRESRHAPSEWSSFWGTPRSDGDSARPHASTCGKATCFPGSCVTTSRSSRA